MPRARNMPIELLRSSANITKILMTKSIPATTVNDPNTKKKPATFSEADSDDSIIEVLISLIETSYKAAFASSSIQLINSSSNWENFDSLPKSNPVITTDVLSPDVEPAISSASVIFNDTKNSSSVPG